MTPALARPPRDLYATLRPLRLAPLSQEPLVSILVSNYNYAHYLPEAIDSVLAQTYGHWELIIADDGSTDRSREVVRAYCERDARIRLLCKPNGGQATGFNLAFAHSAGELICLFDSDDALCPRKLERTVQAHLAAPQSGFGLHRFQRVNRRREPRGVSPRAGGLPEGWRGEELLETGGVLPNLPPTAALSLHRTVAERMFPLPVTPPFPGLADQVVMRLAPLLTSMVPIDEVLSEYRFHGSNTFEPDRVTAQTTLREITNCRALWEAQQTLLRTIHPEIARRQRPVDESTYLLELAYVHARLARSPAWPAAYHRFLERLGTEPHPRLLPFWKHSRWMPAPVFARLLNLIMRPGRLKQALAHVRGARQS